MRRLGVAICVALLIAAAVAVVARGPWHGPILLTLAAGHGVNAGDLLAVPFVVLAMACWPRRAEGAEQARTTRNWLGPASAVVLGVLLVLAGVVTKAGGGPLVPSGGGTLDGTIDQTAGATPLPVDRWSDVAVTYDGATLRLYVNGRQVSSRAANGTLQVSRDPLWIGGNQPYGEYFNGVIDDVRVYTRALRADEIQDDMAKPVAPAGGLVAAYSFDAGSGSVAADSSGERNTGAIRGATWTKGRHGRALRFDGAGAVVSVPPSASLNLTRAMTLSGWIRPSAPQDGWRAVVQRQADAYMLTAGSDRLNRAGRLDDLRAALIVVSLVLLCVFVAAGPAPSSARRRLWWQPVALFVAGSIADAALAPVGSLLGPALVALWLAATASDRAEAVVLLLAALAFAGLTVASLAGLGAVDPVFSPNEGAIARAAALGALFVLGGAFELIRRRPHEY